MSLQPGSATEEQAAKPKQAESVALAAMIEQILEQDVQIEGVTLVREGELLLDCYFQPYQGDEPHAILSCTKSILSCLLGIAVDRHLIDLNRPMLDYFPDLRSGNPSAAKSAITVEHLLTMTSGLTADEEIGHGWRGYLALHNSDDWIQHLLDKPVTAEPGREFCYGNGGSHLLAGILERVTGEPLLEFARNNLFEPLEIICHDWECDPQGRPVGWSGISLLPRDMARFGSLYLHRGLWQGQRILSEDWVRRSTSRRVAAEPYGGYGYHWWVAPDYYMAVGHFGQFIVVLPRYQAVFVTVGTIPARGSRVPLDLLDGYVVPALAQESTATSSRSLSQLLEVARDPERGRIHVWRSPEEGSAWHRTFTRSRPPALAFDFPAHSQPQDLTLDTQIMSIKTIQGTLVNASVADWSGPEDLKAAAEQYVSSFSAVDYVRAPSVVGHHERQVDGVAALVTEIRWTWQSAITMTTLLISMFLEGKYVYLDAHTASSRNEVMAVFESLRLQRRA